MAPACECHGETCWWQKRPDRPNGGYWRCSVRRREVDSRRYYRDQDKRTAAVRQYYVEHREARLQNVREYLLTDQGRAARRRNRLSEATKRRQARILAYDSR